MMNSQFLYRQTRARLRAMLSRRVGNPYAGSTSRGPTQLLIQLLYACNLRCWFCNQWGSTGVFKKLGSDALKQKLPLSVLERVLNELPPTCHTIALWGGETLLYPDLIGLIRAIKKRGFACSMVCNGTQLPKHAAPLAEAGIDVVHVSIDAMESTHDAFRGTAGTFRAAIEGIEILRQHRREWPRRSPKIGVGATVLPQSLGELPDLIRKARLAGADFITINKVSYVTEEMGANHQQALQSLLGLQATSWKGFVRPEEIGHGDAVKNAIEHIMQDPENRDFVLVENAGCFTPHDWERYYAAPTHVAPSDRKCRFPWEAVCLFPNGDLGPCPDFSDHVVGNVQQESFAQIWNGERFRTFRQRLNENGGRFPICSACCHLYD